MASKPALRPVYLVDGSRTPFLKARGRPGPFSASDLAVYACRELLARQPFAATEIGEVVTGCVIPGPDEANIARIIALRIGCGNHVPAWTVQRNCASGLQAIDSAAQNIAQGRYELSLTGGTEAMSRAPLLFNEKMVNWLASWYEARNLPARLQALTRFRPGYLAPVIGLLRGLSDPVVNLSMGQTAENVAYRFGITRAQMDAFAVLSHQRLAQAQDQGYLANEIVPLYDRRGHYYQADDGLRRETTVEKLAKLKPYFDKPFGLVTPGNSSQVSDGAAFLMLASATAVKRYQLPVLGKIIDTQWAALDPAHMGLGPIHAITPLLQRHRLKIADIAAWEINEAFSAQLLGCMAAWQDPDYCRTELGLEGAFGQLDPAIVNVDGSAVALGHPVGASGARLVLHLLHVLKRQQARYGIASLCIGGGQGGAMLIEHTTEVE